jgi:hypothetical protein
MSRPTTANDELELMSTIWSPTIADNPERFVMLAFPWGQPNTPLEKFQGPRTWQRDELLAMADHIEANKWRMSEGRDPLVYQSATASGRGIGKSALVAFLNLWAMSTRIGGTCINTANSESQLKSKTWAELGKWHTLSINSHWFDKQALSLKPQEWFGSEIKRQLKIDTTYYYSEAQLWSKENPDAFAGAHNMLGMLQIFDEASGIPKSIWTVAEGVYTEPTLHRYWLVFSNPRRNTGQFYDCFHVDRNFWKRRNVDSRSVEGTDKTKLNEIVVKHGEDSDEARVEVKGEFPRQGDKQFISREIVEQATEREIVEDNYAPLIMGVDIARYGDDATVIRFRQGRNARILAPVILKGKDNMEVANTLAHLINQYEPDAVCIDSGNGTGVIDRLKEMKFRGIHEVGFGTRSPEEEWANNRTYLWAKMREWLGGGCIDKDSDLKVDLVSPEYKFMANSDKLRLETKEELKDRGFASPDHGDALALTFAVNPPRRDSRNHRGTRRAPIARGTDYKILG